ncbi:hypothetical protein K1T71_012543 [Dendrolimus kikuchii]|uniref:Uncharacterized protein n=1 Tax=Dendrolimus kikuchii TaxID=765133 RepID=A0ACC1CJM3_9NEOP|nr:hypothetical protein K1T71_012543 [Dendrolimus kikuchii]
MKYSTYISSKVEVEVKGTDETLFYKYQLAEKPVEFPTTWRPVSKKTSISIDQLV